MSTNQCGRVLVKGVSLSQIHTEFVSINNMPVSIFILYYVLRSTRLKNKMPQERSSRSRIFSSATAGKIEFSALADCAFAPTYRNET